MIEKLTFGLYDLSNKIQYQILLKEFQIAKELLEDLQKICPGTQGDVRFFLIQLSIL